MDASESTTEVQKLAGSGDSSNNNKNGAENGNSVQLAAVKSQSSVELKVDDRPEVTVKVEKDAPEAKDGAFVKTPKSLSRQHSMFQLDPQKQVTLTFSHLSYTVLNPKDKSPFQILYSVSGIVRPGEVLGVMGPSGSGKTTLLDLLANRVSTGEVKGEIRCNGHLRRASSFRHYSAYVPQQDHLVGTVTVRETLEFSAQLSLPEDMPHDKKMSRVDQVLRELGLESCADTRIGTVFQKGISGGQMRRVSIAVELLTLPTLLFLDEPTSGLDSASALRVMEILQSLAQLGHTIVCSIHQPSSDVFHMLDKVLLMNHGKTIYFGPTQEVVPYFAERGFECPTYVNPADFMIRVTNTDFASVDTDRDMKQDVRKLIDAYAASSSHKTTLKAIEETHKNPGTNLRDTGVAFAVGYVKQFWEITKRTWVDYARNPGVFGVRLFMYTMLSLMIGTMYAGIDNGQKEVIDRAGVLFYIAAFMVFMSIAVIPAFIQERAVFGRERANGWYDVGPYVLANSICGLPGLFIMSLVSTSIIYPMVGLNDEEGRFGLFLANLFMSLVIAESLMAVLSAIVPIYIVGMALGAGIFGMFMLCEGFFMVLENIPDYWIWGYYMGFHAYSFRLFMWTEFDGLALKCDQGATCAFPDGAAVLKYYDMDDTDVAADFAVLIAMFVIYRIIFYAILKVFHTGKR
eukprot:TRINITY_DN67669_c10_g1_i1.p1 TRINITY_DN67669_c10_g1~~TRINITY_DN67669_c10_g1_i1.p1  ORF type:complete len:685 (+),score=379.37 TRINITY_DN67669_c10_g1_i1:148-2202(+)